MEREERAELAKRMKMCGEGLTAIASLMESLKDEPEDSAQKSKTEEPEVQTEAQKAQTFNDRRIMEFLSCNGSMKVKMELMDLSTIHYSSTLVHCIRRKLFISNKLLTSADKKVVVVIGMVSGGETTYYGINFKKGVYSGSDVPEKRIEAASHPMVMDVIKYIAKKHPGWLPETPKVKRVVTEAVEISK